MSLTLRPSTPSTSALAPVAAPGRLAAPIVVEDATKVIDGVTVSVAATDWEPSVFRVTGKVPVPFASALAAGRTAAPSLLVN